MERQGGEAGREGRSQGGRAGGREGGRTEGREGACNRQDTSPSACGGSPPPPIAAAACRRSTPPGFKTLNAAAAAEGVTKSGTQVCIRVVGPLSSKYRIHVLTGMQCIQPGQASTTNYKAEIGENTKQQLRQQGQHALRRMHLFFFSVVVFFSKAPDVRNKGTVAYATKDNLHSRVLLLGCGLTHVSAKPPHTK